MRFEIDAEGGPNVLEADRPDDVIELPNHLGYLLRAWIDAEEGSEEIKAIKPPLLKLLKAFSSAPAVLRLIKFITIY